VIDDVPGISHEGNFKRNCHGQELVVVGLNVINRGMTKSLIGFVNLR